MRPLNNSIDIDTFWTRVATSSQRVLFLDYDGTLAPFRVEPGEAHLLPGIRDRLKLIIAGGRTRVVIVTGRSCDDLERLIDLPTLPEIWGEHGAECRNWVGRRSMITLEPVQQAGLDKAREYLASQCPQLRMESKRTSVAAHWRGVSPELVSEIRPVIGRCWSKLAHTHQLRVQPFDGGLELRPSGVDKGMAVRFTLAEEAGPTVAAYLGDDQTDEDGFKALKTWVAECRAEHFGLAGLVSREQRFSEADLLLQDPTEVLSFLEHWSEAIGG